MNKSKLLHRSEYVGAVIQKNINILLYFNYCVCLLSHESYLMSVVKSFNFERSLAGNSGNRILRRVSSL